jgi:hypothetical protein
VSPYHKLCHKLIREPFPSNKFSKTRERVSTFFNELPHLHPKGFYRLRRTPPTPRTAIFGVYHYSPPRISLKPIPLQPFA